MNNRPSRCIDCGAPCYVTAYRCRPCADKERGAYLSVTGKAITAGMVRSATQRNAFAEARAERVAFVDQQLGYGFLPGDIAADLGIDHNSVARSMYRAGRPDLGRRFEHRTARKPGRHYAKGYRCEECGQRRSDQSQRWCVGCRNRVGTRAAA